ncbi:hypothetical protein [Xylophilus sp. ASV27]|uniref:hypothetical protein n=1 Tax=Xylophilus sp. ASV27 TaxID=2795129 RepID=UPI0018EC03F9|nr:hypothetical protein [Xylophilus sp. ASV27]
MSPMRTTQFLAIGAAAVLAAAAAPSFAAQAALQGAFALPGVTGKATAELVVRETGPLTRELLIAFSDKATGRPITQFDQELTQELHVLGTDSGFSSFVHEHAARLGPDGRFRVAMRFPKPGTYHVYADAVPSGLGQQVVRFTVPVGVAASPADSPRAPAAGPQGSDGPYTVELDASALRAGTEGMVALTILKDGAPAKDLGLYLGVPAHAVFVNTDDLAYVHAHAMAADAAHGGHARHESHGAHGARKAAIPARLVLHATPPRAGRYALWIQFMGGGRVRTVPFVITVAAAP